MEYNIHVQEDIREDLTPQSYIRRSKRSDFQLTPDAHGTQLHQPTQQPSFTTLCLCVCVSVCLSLSSYDYPFRPRDMKPQDLW